MTTEELRTIIVTGLTNILAHPLLLLNLSADQIKVVKAQRGYWQADDGTQLAKLLLLEELELSTSPAT
jgi:hypothetical protein